MRERLQKIIAARGMTSRRGAEEWIAQGRVLCNGVTAAPGTLADPEVDEILVDGKPLRSADRPAYLMLHKPRGYVTTLQDERGRPNAAQLVADCGVRVYPIGRLDMDSEGLLLLTNDGDLANRLMHPSHQVKKTYQVWVRGYHPGKEALLRRPVELDGRPIRPPQVVLAAAEGERAKFTVTIHEGRNRQIRRMCRLADMEVTRLRRVAEGGLRLGKLPMGAWRYLTESEIQALKRESGAIFSGGTCKNPHAALK